MDYYNEYLGMTAKEALETFCRKYYADGNATESGVIANFIKKYIEDESIPIEDHEALVEDAKQEYVDLELEKDDLEREVDDLESQVHSLKRKIIDFMDEKIEDLQNMKFEVDAL